MSQTRITLKHITHSEKLSRETNAFTADVYFDGKKVGYAENDGHGGSTNVCRYPETREEFKAAEVYAKSLPQTDYGTFKVDSDLEHVVDNLLEDWLKAKDDAKYQKQLEKNMVEHLCFGVDCMNYTMRFWKNGTKKMPLGAVWMSVQGKELLRKAIAEVKAEGHKILNTNLPKDLLS